jgi:hypothetical protein
MASLINIRMVTENTIKVADSLREAKDARKSYGSGLPTKYHKV